MINKKKNEYKIFFQTKNHNSRSAIKLNNKNQDSKSKKKDSVSIKPNLVQDKIKLGMKLLEQNFKKKHSTKSHKIKSDLLNHLQIQTPDASLVCPELKNNINIFKEKFKRFVTMISKGNNSQFKNTRTSNKPTRSSSIKE